MTKANRPRPATNNAYLTNSIIIPPGSLKTNRLFTKKLKAPATVLENIMLIKRFESERKATVKMQKSRTEVSIDENTNLKKENKFVQNR